MHKINWRYLICNINYINEGDGLQRPGSEIRGSKRTPFDKLRVSGEYGDFRSW